MIGSFKHKGLKQIHEEDSAHGVSAEHAQKLRLILSLLEASDYH